MNGWFIIEALCSFVVFGVEKAWLEEVEGWGWGFWLLRHFEEGYGEVRVVVAVVVVGWSMTICRYCSAFGRCCYVHMMNGSRSTRGRWLLLLLWCLLGASSIQEADQSTGPSGLHPHQIFCNEKAIPQHSSSIKNIMSTSCLTPNQAKHHRPAPVYSKMDHEEEEDLAVLIYKSSKTAKARAAAAAKEKGQMKAAPAGRRTTSTRKRSSATQDNEEGW